MTTNATLSPAFSYTGMTHDLLTEDLTTEALNDLTALIQGGLQDLRTALDNRATDKELTKLVHQLLEDLAYATHDPGITHAEHGVYDAFDRAERAWETLDDTELLEEWYAEINA